MRDSAFDTSNFGYLLTLTPAETQVLDKVTDVASRSCCTRSDNDTERKFERRTCEEINTKIRKLLELGL